MQKFGIDCSHWQVITDYERLNKQDFIICKCTEALTFADPTFKKNKTEIRKLPHPVFGAYHFARNNNPIKEADWFLKNLGEVTKDDIICLDAEDGQTAEWCETFLKTVEVRLGIKPYLYAPVAGWTRALDYPLWVARYGLNTGTMDENYPPKIGKWKDWTIWQYTSRGKVDGIVGNVDMNVAKFAPQEEKEPEMTSLPTYPPIVAPTAPSNATEPLPVNEIRGDSGIMEKSIIFNKTNMEQTKNAFDKATLGKIGRGALIAGGGALVVYLLQAVSVMDFGEATPIIVALCSIIINAAKEYKTGK